MKIVGLKWPIHALTIMLIGLKLTGNIDWSWLYVFLPYAVVFIIEEDK
jgi:hypothetical protein